MEQNIPSNMSNTWEMFYSMTSNNDKQAEISVISTSNDQRMFIIHLTVHITLSGAFIYRSIDKCLIYSTSFGIAHNEVKYC